MNKRLHTVPEALHLLGVGRTLFYREVARGRLLVVKAGHKSLVPQSSIEQYERTLIAEAEAARKPQAA